MNFDDPTHISLDNRYQESLRDFGNDILAWLRITLPHAAIRMEIQTEIMYTALIFVFHDCKQPETSGWKELVYLQGHSQAPQSMEFSEIGVQLPILMREFQYEDSAYLRRYQEHLFQVVLTQYAVMRLQQQKIQLTSLSLKT